MKRQSTWTPAALALAVLAIGPVGAEDDLERLTGREIVVKLDDRVEVELETTFADRPDLSLYPDGGDGFIVAWSRSFPSEPSTRVMARRFDRHGRGVRRSSSPAPTASVSAARPSPATGAVGSLSLGGATGRRRQSSGSRPRSSGTMEARSAIPSSSTGSPT